MHTTTNTTFLKESLNGIGMGASLAVLELEKETQSLAEQEMALDLEIESLTFYRDQLRTELNSVNNSRLTQGLTGAGLGLFKSAYRRQLERSVTNKTQRIADKTRQVASLNQEITQLQFQLDTLAPNSEVLKATKQAMISGGGLNLNPKVLIALAVLAGGGYLAYKKGWLEKLGIKS